MVCTVPPFRQSWLWWRFKCLHLCIRVLIPKIDLNCTGFIGNIVHICTLRYWERREFLGLIWLCFASHIKIFFEDCRLEICVQSETFQKNQKYPYSRTLCSLDADQHLCFFPLCLLLVEVKGCVMLPSLSFFLDLWGYAWKSVCLIYHFMLVYSPLKTITKADEIFPFLPKK